MTDTRAVPASYEIAGFFWATLAAAVVLALLILILPGAIFLKISNYLQILTALAGAFALLFLWHKSRKKEFLLWAGAGLGLWGIANIGWYVTILMGQRDMVFPGIIDAGIIASILILGFAFRKGFARKPTSPCISPYISLCILAVSLLIPAAVIAIVGLSPATLVTLIYFAACGTLLVTGLNHAPEGSPMVLSGLAIFALTFMIYPLRELLLITNPILPVIGTFVVMGFSILVLGLLPISSPEQTA